MMIVSMILDIFFRIHFLRKLVIEISRMSAPAEIGQKNDIASTLICIV